MHHGESSLYLYYFGLADPLRQPDRARALRFAGMYLGTDPEAANWDAERRMIRSPITGSRGPRFENTFEDWEAVRWVLADYPVPFDDLEVPTTDAEWYPGEVVAKADWNDDAVFAVILEALNRRQMRGDVPLNLTCTSLLTHAFLLTGEQRYRRWVLDYLEAWADRIAANGGPVPGQRRPRRQNRRDHGRQVVGRLLRLGLAARQPHHRRAAADRGDERAAADRRHRLPGDPARPTGAPDRAGAQRRRPAAGASPAYRRRLDLLAAAGAAHRGPALVPVTGAGPTAR